MKTITFDHLIYDQQGFVRGNHTRKHEVFGDDIKRLTKDADLALYRQHGHFFDSIQDDVFVYGFLNTEPEHRNECFFDLYTTSLDEVSVVSLSEVHDGLSECNSSLATRHDNIDEKVRIDVQSYYDRSGSGCVQDGESGDSTPSPDDIARDSTCGDSRLTEFTSYQQIASIWERYRRGSAPGRVDLDEISRFVIAIDGALPRVNFVSQVRKGGDPSSFDFAGGGSPRTVDTDWLEAYFQERTLNELQWDDLPTYSDQLHELNKKFEKDIRSCNSYDRLWEKIEQEVQPAVNKIGRQQASRAIDIYSRASQNDLDQEDEAETNRFQQLRDTVRGSRSEDREEHLILDGLETDVVDEAVQREIARQLEDQVQSELEEILQEEVLTQLEMIVRRSIEEHTKDFVKTTIESLDELKASRPYEEAEITPSK